MEGPGSGALWLLLPVLLYPFYWWVLMLIPDPWRAVSIAAGLAVIALPFVSLITAGVAIVRDKQWSILLGKGRSADERRLM